MGKVFIVGIGPGNEENRTIRADRALEACDVIAGYPVYVDLVKDRYPGKELLSTYCKARGVNLANLQKQEYMDAIMRKYGFR